MSPIHRTSRSPVNHSATPRRVPSSPFHSPVTRSRATTQSFPALVQHIMLRERAGSPGQDSDDTSVPHMEIEGKSVWEQFDSHATALDKDLQKFQDAVQELGSSLDMVRAAWNMRDCVSLITWHFRENARKLFPRAIVSGGDRPQAAQTRHVSRQRTRGQRSWPPNAATPNFNAFRNSETKPIYDDLKAFARSVENLRDALEQFPEFRNFENLSLRYFEDDLKYWALCLEHYEGQFDSREVQTYVHDLSQELADQFEDAGLCLREYVAFVPTARLSQKNNVSNLQSLATVATFFSAVTATTIQYSFTNNDDAVSKAVNTLWFGSLVFSIASALNSFLVLTWRRAIYSSPQLRVPSWLWVWIRYCPQICLLVSVVTFLAGLGCFTVSSTQSHSTWIIVFIGEGIGSLSLAALLVWLAADKWSFLHLRQPSEKYEPVLPTSTTPGEHAPSGCLGYLSDAGSALSPFSLPLKSFFSPALRKGELPGSDPLPKPPKPPHPRPEVRTVPVSRDLIRQRWTRAINKVIDVRRAVQEVEAKESRRMSELQPYLRTLSPIKDLELPGAGTATTSIQFNPQGNSLASQDGDTLRQHIGQARQVMWLASGRYLLTRTYQAIHVWPQSEDIEHKMIMRSDASRLLLRIPGIARKSVPRFISIEGSNRNKMAILDIGGEEHMRHVFKDISIQHADIAPEGSWILMASVKLPIFDEIRPAKASPQRMLTAFNIESRRVEHEVPLWHEVQQVAISKDGTMALVSYNNYPPPQLWNLQSTPNGIHLSLQRQFYGREKVSALEFDPTQHIQFCGKAQFLNNDRFVICPTVEGKIHFWRRDRSDPIYILGRLMEDVEKPVQVECNPASEDFMFATRSRDGIIRIWHAPPQSTYSDTTGSVRGIEDHVSIATHERVLTESPQDEFHGESAGGSTRRNTE